MANAINNTGYKIPDGVPSCSILSKFDYRIMTAVDVPKEIHGDIVETPLEDGPRGARGVGEHVMVPTAPAVANGINDALGIRFNDLPLSAENIFLALEERKRIEE